MQPRQVISQVYHRRPASLREWRVLNIRHEIGSVGWAIRPVRPQKIGCGHLISDTEFIDEVRRDPIVADRISPSMTALCTVDLSRIRSFCIVQGVDRRVTLPAPSEEGVVVRRDVVIAFQRVLILETVAWSVESEAGRIQAVTNI